MYWVYAGPGGIEEWGVTSKVSEFLLGVIQM